MGSLDWEADYAIIGRIKVGAFGRGWGGWTHLVVIMGAEVDETRIKRDDELYIVFFRKHFLAIKY